MNINRNNYEEYFILYLDNELGMDERRSVEEFAKANPDLQEELDLLLQTKLTPDNHIVFENREDLLFSDSDPVIDLTNYEEWLVLYTDNELNPIQRTAVEQFAASYPHVKVELDLYLQTRLQPEAVIFDDKKALYRRDEKARGIVWWKVAAAAAVLFAIGTTTLMIVNRGGNAPEERIAAKPIQKKETRSTTPVISNDTKPGDSQQTDITTEIEQPVVKTGEAAAMAKRESPSQATKKVVPSITTKEDDLIVANKATKTLPNDLNIAVKTNEHANSKIITDINANIQPIDIVNIPDRQLHKNISDKVPVTQHPSETYIKADEPANPEDDNFIYANQGSGKKSKLRGFLRKVTRTFEKNTDIDATDGDDRLLVGGLAIKL